MILMKMYSVILSFFYFLTCYMCPNITFMMEKNIDEINPKQRKAEKCYSQ